MCVLFSLIPRVGFFSSIYYSAALSRPFHQPWPCFYSKCRSTLHERVCLVLCSTPDLITNLYVHEILPPSRDFCCSCDMDKLPTRTHGADRHTHKCTPAAKSTMSYHLRISAQYFCTCLYTWYTTEVMDNPMFAIAIIRIATIKLLLSASQKVQYPQKQFIYK